MINELIYLFPAAIPGEDFTLQDDGAGPVIKTWNSAKLGAKPTAATISNATAAAALAAAKSAQIATLGAAYNTAIQQPVSYMSTTFQADSTSQQTLTRCLVSGSVPTGFYWLDANNVQVPMTFAQLQGLASAMLVQGQAAFTRLQTRKASVNGATTVSAVQAVVW